MTKQGKEGEATTSEDVTLPANDIGKYIKVRVNMLPDAKYSESESGKPAEVIQQIVKVNIDDKLSKI